MTALKSKYALILFCIFLFGNLFAQQTIVNIAIDSTDIYIGEQTYIHLEVVTDQNKKVLLPVFADTIMKGIEVLEMPKADTTKLDNNRIQIEQKYLITSFDSALYLLPSLVVVDGTDSIFSNRLGLKVNTLQVDTESKKIYDIKNVFSPPFVWKDYIWVLWIVLAVVVLSIITIILIFKLQGKPTKISSFKKKEPPLPPHVKAIRLLDGIKNQKLWQQGRLKEFHSQIVDILRVYIDERFGIPAMEMTSGEILNKIRSLDETDSVFENLKQILQLSDFVKFAKYQPLPDENELSLMNSYLFVNQTIKQEVIRSENVSIPTQNEGINANTQVKDI